MKVLTAVLVLAVASTEAHRMWWSCDKENSEADLWESAEMVDQLPNSQIPEQPAEINFGDFSIQTDALVTTDKLEPNPIVELPCTWRDYFSWTQPPTEKYTFLIADVDIERPDPSINSFIHMAYSNIPLETIRESYYSCKKVLNVTKGTEIYNLIPPFTFTVEDGQLNEDPSLNIHRMAMLIFKQTDNQDVTAPDTGDSCSGQNIGSRMGDYIVSLVEGLNLKTPAAYGKFVKVPYSFDATKEQFCYIARCTGAVFPPGTDPAETGVDQCLP